VGIVNWVGNEVADVLDLDLDLDLGLDLISAATYPSPKALPLSHLSHFSHLSHSIAISD
jgi:hypothetical protein